MAVLQGWERLAAEPATDAQLAQIWPAWNALPADMIPEVKRKILTFDETSEYDCDSEWLAPFQKLRQRFGDLPFRRPEFTQALNQAIRWSSLMQYLQSTRKLHQKLITRQWAFAEADSQAAARIAIFRAAKELEITHPGLLKAKRPKLADISCLDSRYSAYSQARDEALKAISDLLYKVPGMRTRHSLPLDEVALGMPNPPDDVPRYLFIARLDALGLCSHKRLNGFLQDELPKLTREKRQKFYSMSLKPRYGKEPYATLRIWLLENRPIFEHPQFAWQWGDIEAAAAEKGINCPHTSLKQWASRNRLRLRVKRGPTTLNASRITLSKVLLSPAPVFGDILKSPLA